MSRTQTVSSENVTRGAQEPIQQGEVIHRGHDRKIAAGGSDGCLLQAYFFGQFKVFCCGKKIAPSRRRRNHELSILKYLLMNRYEPVSQDHLMGWLWPEANLKKARWSLNSAIRKVRTLLSTCPSSEYENSVLLEDGYYRLGAALLQVETDVDEFDAYYQRGLRLENANGIAEAVTKYQKAVDIYQGDFLVEDLYEDWTMVERERLISALVDILDRLSTQYYATGQYQECLRICHRLLSKDLCYERGHALIMKCYASLGLRVRASHQYQMYQHYVQQKLGQDPSPEMAALHHTILVSGTID